MRQLRDDIAPKFAHLPWGGFYWVHAHQWCIPPAWYWAGRRTQNDKFCRREGAGLIKKGAIQTRYYARKSVLLFDLLSLSPFLMFLLSCVVFLSLPHRFTNRMGGRIYIWGSSLLHQVSWNVWHGKNIDRKTLMDAERDGDGLGGLSWAVGCCFVCLVSSEIPSPLPTSWPVCSFGGIPKSFCLAAL